MPMVIAHLGDYLMREGGLFNIFNIPLNDVKWSCVW